MCQYRHQLRCVYAVTALLVWAGPLSGQSTLATFSLTEYFGVGWPTQNIEMRYDGGHLDKSRTRMLNASGSEIPYQWISGANCWDPTAMNGCILVQDSLAPNATNTYTLQSGIAPAATVTNPVTVTSGTCQSGVAGWLISNGLTGFCVAKTQSSPYNDAPLQGIELSNGVWTGAAAGTPNLIYQNPVTGTWPNSTAQDLVPYGSGQAALKMPATIFTGETTTFVDSGPLKTSVQLSYTANRPLYYFISTNTTGGTSATISVPYSPQAEDCGTMGLYFTQNSPHPLPAGLHTNTVYYNAGCTLSGNTPGNTNYTTVTYSLSATPGGTPITLGSYNGEVNGVWPVANTSGSGHLTVILTLYANRPAFSYDFDTDLNIQYFVPLYNEVQPNLRRYRGASADSAACGYETPLTITNISNTNPPVVTVSNTLNAMNGNQINITGVNGATGANGTFYACAVNNARGTFTLNTSATCSTLTNAPAPGTYTSGGIGKPQYQSWNARPPRDAFYDISYASSHIPVLVTCSSSTIPLLGINYPPNWPDAGYYDMVYNSQGGMAAPVIGLFEGRLSKLFNTSGSEQSQPGWFSSNSHWIGAYNVNCPSGKCAFGIEHILRVNELAPTTHGNFGIYVGSVGQLLPPDWTQPIKVEQNSFEGINLSSLYTYTLNYPDPQPGNPPDNGWTWPYMASSDFNAWVNLFQHSASYCASSGTCTGDSGYYNVMKASEATSGAIQDLWHYNDAAHATAAYRAVLNEGSVGQRHMVISGASWYAGTETLAIGPHAIVAGQTVTVTGFTPATYNCNNCTVTAVTPTTISYALQSNPGSYTAAGSVLETGLQGFVNELANYENLWFPNTEYYQLFLSEFVYAFPQCTALILNSNSTQSQKTGCKTILGLAGSLIWDNDFWPSGNINGNGNTTSGDNGGLQNQVVQWYQYRAEVAAQLYFHPYLASKVAMGNSYTLGSISAMANQYGAGPGSLHYQGTYTTPTYEAFEISALSGSFPNFTFANSSYPWRQHARWFLSGLTPPEPRFGNMRKCLSDGDGNTEAECAVHLGLLAEGLASVDATTAGNAIWGWAQTNTNNKTYTVDQNTVWSINPLVPSVTPALTSGNFPGYWSVARYGFGTPYETTVHFINGDFYSTQGHRHNDDGQVSIYAQSAPLAIDWNANLYYPDTGASYCHNRVVLDSEISGNLGAWNNDAPNCAIPGATAATGPLLKAVETNFNAFLNSTQSIADFVYGDATVWTRAVRTIAADPAYPLIYVKDTFSGPSATVPKTLTWNLMSTGSVVTPAGVVTPAVRYSGPPNAPTGCNNPAAQFPSNGTVYSLGNGLQQFTFTGASWRAHATGGINWDLWQIPASGSAQFLIGNWGHGCNTAREMAEFQATNGIAFNERQHILRVHDTGTFQTLIAPYRNGETPMRTVTMESCGIQIVQGPEITCFNDSALTYTNGTTQVLTVYDTSSQSAFGFTASGGAQELVNNGAGTITWTIEDTVAATRCVTLPATASLQSGTGVQYSVNTGQYCYYQGASPQPAAVVVTFTVR
jgi:hypothetical protein